jgi:septum site-determining protein MinC
VLTRQFVSLKGTRRGILVGISEECPLPEAMTEFRATIAEKRHFFNGSPVSLDLGWRELSEEDHALLTHTIADCHLQLMGVISSSLATRRLLESHGIKVIIGALGLAKHGGNARVKATASTPRGETSPAAEAAVPAAEAAPPPLENGERTMMVRKTLRSGQRIQFAGNVVVLGDVNAGAEIEAEGDVLVLGNVRGIVHAGCKGKEDAVVVALNLHAAQLRIGNLIGMVTSQKGYSNNAAVMARIHDGSVATCLYGR